MPTKTIKNNVEKLRTITVDEFLALEFNSLKDPKRNVVKLKNSIRKNGWSFPLVGSDIGVENYHLINN